MRNNGKKLRCGIKSKWKEKQIDLLKTKEKKRWNTKLTAVVEQWQQ